MISIFAPAKINLYLHVVGRRADGYHLLDSLVVFADVGDTVSVAPAPSLRLAISGPFAPALATDGDNLVLRAADALAIANGHPAAADIRLEKRLPVASGIGGGSADAAATLSALTELWQARLDPAQLAAVALSLGADVPMCLARRPLQVEGIGETIAPAPPLPPFWLVLANPGVALPTQAVFRARSGGFSPADPITGPVADASALASLLARRRNDLTAAAVALCPEVGDVLAALARDPAALLVRMSGSGATCFGLFASAEAASACAQQLAGDHPGWWVVAAAGSPPGRPVAAPGNCD
jgi:4-diphosphocytidyl-2-C-methyl-D-erythritol kinase